MGEPESPKTQRFPRAFGKYQLLREAGRGGRGVVYEATDTVLQRGVALKVVLAAAGTDAAALKVEEDRFLVEARIGAHLPKHPHIVAVYEAGEIEGRRYLAAEYVQGEAMSTWRRKPAATVGQQVRLLRDVALAVEHANRHGVVHRDLKPGNVLVDAQGQPRLTDFGLAKMAGQALDLAQAAPGHVLGTPYYMSPEHARGLDTIDARADVYSLGAMLYEILCGHPPFHSASRAEVLQIVVSEPVPPPSGLAKAPFPPALKPLEALALKALSKDPAQRPASAKEFADELGRWLEGGKGTLRRPAPPKKSSVPLLAMAGAIVLVVAGLAAFALLGRSGATQSDPAAEAAKEARSRERIEQDKRRAVEQAAEQARREESERSREEQQRLIKDAEARRKENEEETLKQRASLLVEKREAEERAKKAEEELKKASQPVAPPPAPIPQPPPPTPARASVPRLAPAAVKIAPTGFPKVLPDGTLHFEAEDYSGGEKAVEGKDYHDGTPRNTGGTYRQDDVDIAPHQDGSIWVGAIEAGEWLNFRLEGEGRFELEMRYTAGQQAATHLEIDGVNITGPLSPPQTNPGIWSIFKATTHKIPAGTHDLRFVFDARIFGLDWFRLRKIVPAPPPGAAALKEAEKTIRNLFKAEYARKSAPEVQAFAHKLLQEGLREVDPVLKFALLSEARETAEQAADPATALAAVDVLDKWFAVDALAMRQESLASCARAARTPDALKSVVDAYMALAELAAAREEYDAAVALAGKAESPARASQDAGLAARVTARAKELAQQRDDFKPIRAALKTLEEKPDDPTANLAVGSYRCFTRHAWPRGLPMLAKGSDAGLAGLARKELDGAADLALGDAWREAGEKRSGAMKPRLLSRALHWYEKAMPGLTGLDRVKVEGQVDSLYKSIGGDSTKKGLVFWVEPGQSPSDPFRELVFGSKVTNNGVQTADAGVRVLSFTGGSLDYACPDAVKNVDRTGSIFVWQKSDLPFGALVHRAEPERNQADFWLWFQGRRLELGFNFPDPAHRLNARGTLAPGQWIHCGATWDDQKVVFYVDGKEESVSPRQPAEALLRRTSRVRIGAWGPGAVFQGMLGSVMIYNRTVSALEVGQLHGANRGRFR